MQQFFYQGHNPLGFHKLAYTEWGQAKGLPPVLCVHGLLRNSRDFDRLATTLQKTKQVFCPDIAGRGQSDWLGNPEFYNYTQYSSDLTALIARIGATPLDWIGTSMGGTFGMFMAADQNSPIRRLVLNDIGPFIPKAALQRISTYANVPNVFANLDEAEIYFRKTYASFGITQDDDWRQMAVHSTRLLPDGSYITAYDPMIGKSMKEPQQDVDFWAVYDRISCPVLVIHGGRSDVLPLSVAEDMTRRGPKARLVTLPDIGHAPSLMDEDQIRLIVDFLK